MSHTVVDLVDDNEADLPSPVAAHPTGIGAGARTLAVASSAGFAARAVGCAGVGSSAEPYLLEEDVPAAAVSSGGRGSNRSGTGSNRVGGLSGITSSSTSSSISRGSGSSGGGSGAGSSSSDGTSAACAVVIEDDEDDFVPVVATSRSEVEEVSAPARPSKQQRVTIDDELEITGTAGDTLAASLPHSRGDCPLHKFIASRARKTAAANDSHCEKW